jgi:hypothetical protein
MPLSVYQASIPVLIRAFDNLAAILVKAEAHAAEKKIPVSRIQALPIQRQPSRICWHALLRQSTFCALSRKRNSPAPRIAPSPSIWGRAR